MNKSINTKLGDFSKARFNALLNVRQTALEAFRQELSNEDFLEVSTSSLVNVAGSCENPHASFTLNFFGREAHLSQSAQLQLEALVIRLQRAVFTVNNSFREENFDDPDNSGRRLSEFTLIEPEKPLLGLTANQALGKIIRIQEMVLKNVIKKVLANCEIDIAFLGGDADFLTDVIKKDFVRIKYIDALEILNSKGERLTFGDDLGMREERELLAHFGNTPTFVTYFPAQIKFFNTDKSRQA